PFADATVIEGQESPVVGKKGGRSPSPDGSTFEEPRAYHFRRYLFNFNYASLTLKKIEAILVSPNSMWRKTAEIIPVTFVLLAKDTNVHKKLDSARSRIFTKRGPVQQLPGEGVVPERREQR